MYPGESGQGYALRLAAENQLNGLPQVKILLGKSRYATLDAVDTPLLHRWFGADVESLDQALGWTHTGLNSTGYVYAGQALGRSYFLNRGYPRVCFECLRSHGYCPATWDFSLHTACATHGVVLSDLCPHCIRPLSWNRPAPRICHCYHELSTQAEPKMAAELEIQFAVWCAYRSHNDRSTETEAARIARRIAAGQAAWEPLMRLLWPLSLNGGMHVSYALATAAGYEKSLPKIGPRPRTPLDKARHSLFRANELAAMIDRQLGAVQLPIERPSVVIQLLAECMTGGAPPADRHLAQSLLTTVLHQKRKTKWSGANPQLSQMALF